MRHKKWIYAIGLSLCSFATVNSKAQEAVLPSGAEALGSGGNVSYSVGQIGFTAQSGTNGSVESGVQQSYSILTSLGEEITEIQLELAAYPNPVTTSLSLKVENYNQEKLSYFLYSVNGKLIENRQVLSGVTIIKVDHLPKSTYFLTVRDNTRAVKTFNIIKN